MSIVLAKPIISQRLLLRPYEPADFSALQRILGDPITMQFWPRPFLANEVEGWLERYSQQNTTGFYGRRGVFLQATGELIGDAGVMHSEVAGEMRSDLGYILHHSYWGKGYAHEAASALMNYAFHEGKLPELFANMPWDHVASQKVAERLGMQRIKTFENQRNRGFLTYLYWKAAPAQHVEAG